MDLISAILLVLTLVITGLSFMLLVRQSTLKAQLALAEERSRQAEKELELQLDKLRQEQERSEQALEALAQRRESAARVQTQLEGAESRLTAARQELDTARIKEAELQQQLRQVGDRRARLETELEQQQLRFDAQLRQLEESRALMKREFESLAQEILEKKGKSFQEVSQQNIAALLSPMRTELNGFKERIEKMHQVDADQRVQLRTELQNLQKLNKEITDQAESLTKALQGQKKVQGNWGELMLENVLDSSGLRRDQDYKREVSIDTEEGRMRPDVVVYLPQGKHLIIDAKTSLAAYTRYVNAEDEGERLQALREHSEAVEARIKELADKSYYKLNGLNSPEVVIMFIPIESAYVEALKFKETLFQEALRNQVLVATPTTLLTSLNIVRQLWRFEDQSKHSAQLADRAEKFYAKLNTFLQGMQDVGKRIEGVKVSYDRALSQLYSGRGNLIKQASEFKELGVSVTKELPAELVEKAALELDLQPAAEPQSAPSGQL